VRGDPAQESGLGAIGMDDVKLMLFKEIDDLKEGKDVHGRDGMTKAVYGQKLPAALSNFVHELATGLACYEDIIFIGIQSV
jgi:hypothetical protein